MALKKRKIIQCPLCDSNRLYIRKGLISDILISLIVPVRSYSCGSCSSNFRKYENYFLSKQALFHILIVLALVVFFKPAVLSPEFWTFDKKNQVSESDNSTTEVQANTTLIKTSDNSPPVHNASTNGTFDLNSTLASLNANASEATNSTIPANASSPLSSEEISAHADNSTDEKPAKSKEHEDSISSPKPATLSSGVLSSIYFSEHGGKTRVKLDLGAAPLSYTSFFLKDPARLVVDVLGEWEYAGKNVLTPENPIFSKFRIGVYQDKIRLVMDLKGESPAPIIKKTQTGLNITLK